MRNGLTRKIDVVPNDSPSAAASIHRRYFRDDGRKRLLQAMAAVALVAAALLALTDAHGAPRKKVVVPAPTPPAMRLGDSVKPLAYEAELTVVPTQERFAGHIVIHVELARATDFFWMNATKLDIRQASVQAGGKTIPGKAVAGGQDFVGLRFAAPLPAGRAVITIDYDGVIDKSDAAGVFRQQDGGNWYAFTQFENTYARRAFPCFDEPGWKTPWHLSLIVPAADVAVSNSPSVGEEPFTAPIEAKPVRRGVVVPSEPVMPMKRVRFAPTPPLPSYLVAFAVGPFDVVDGGRAGKKGTQLRYIVPKGRAGELNWVKETTPKLLDQLEDYFGQPYPFDKLDSVAVPFFTTFGAMENAGMITYQMSDMLAKPEQESERYRRNWAFDAAHEMAHQWFGDLVTMQWWNDTWLNESFATWMSAKVIDRVFPVWQTRLSGDDRRIDAIRIDRLASTRQVRQPVNTPDDLNNVFDSITYEKGAAVLAMFEGAIGEERFRNGVRRYLYEHAQGSARAEDFYGALSAEAGPDNASTVAALKGFIEQPGVPRLAVSLDCGVDGKAPPKLILTQSRFVPSRPIGDPAFTQKWSFPACFQFGQGGDFNETCTVIQDTRTALPLPAGESCPAWVLPNRGGSGYFVSALTVELDQQLARTPLLPSEAIPALDDAAILTATGEWPADLALEFAARFANNRAGAGFAGRVGARERGPRFMARRCGRSRGFRAVRPEELRREGADARVDREEHRSRRRRDPAQQPRSVGRGRGRRYGSATRGAEVVTRVAGREGRLPTRRRRRTDDGRAVRARSAGTRAARCDDRRASPDRGRRPRDPARGARFFSRPRARRSVVRHALRRARRGGGRTCGHVQGPLGRGVRHPVGPLPARALRCRREASTGEFDR